MCWSAEADLVAGAGIAAVGTACAARALRTGRTGDLPLAALPLLLGVHQMIEAAVWASDGGTGPAVLLWAVVALPLLALWVPVGVLCAAPKDARRDALRRLMLPLVAGAVTAAVLGRVLTTRPVRAEIRGRTIGYVVDLSYAPLLVAGYLVATAGPLLLSGDRGPAGPRCSGRCGRARLLDPVAAGVRLDLVRVRRRVLAGPVRVGAGAWAAGGVDCPGRVTAPADRVA